MKTFTKMTASALLALLMLSPVLAQRSNGVVLVTDPGQKQIEKQSKLDQKYDRERGKLREKESKLDAKYRREQSKLGQHAYDRDRKYDKKRQKQIEKERKHSAKWRKHHHRRHR